MDLIFVHDIHHPQYSRTLKQELEKVSKIEFQFIEGKFGNPGAARNAGKMNAKGRWITFWDSDDVIYVNEILKLVNEAEVYGATIAVAPFNLVNKKGISKTIPIKSIKSKAYSQYPGIWRFLFRTSILLDKNFPPLRMAEDQLFLLRCDVYSHTLMIGSHPTYNYFVGDPKQATQELTGLPDLVAARDLLVQSLPLYEGENGKFAIRLLLRQNLTLFKHRKKLSNPNSFLRISHLLITHPYICMQEIFEMMVRN